MALDPMNTLLKAILLTETKIVSFTILSQKGVFRKSLNGENGRALAKTASQALSILDFGTIETYVSSGNNAQVNIIHILNTF